MLRLTVAVALIGSLASGALARSSGAASHRKHKSKCQRLKGKDLAPARKVKLVEH